MWNEIDKTFTVAETTFLTNPSTGQIWESEQEAIDFFYPKFPTPIPESTIVHLTEIETIISPLRLIDGVVVTECGQLIEIVAKCELPDTEFTVGVGKLINGVVANIEIRRPAVILNGQISFKFKIKTSGNYEFSSTTVNTLLKEQGKNFVLAFDPIRFNAHDPI